MAANRARSEHELEDPRDSSGGAAADRDRVKRIGIVAAAVLPMVVAAVAPSASAGQRIDRVGFLVAGLLAGFGLTRLTGWLDPSAVAGLAAARVADGTDRDGAVETAGPAARAEVATPVERPVLFDHAAVDDVAALAPVADPEPAVAGPEPAPEPVVVADPVAVADASPAPARASTKGKRKGSSKAAKRPVAPADPVAAEPVVPAPVVAVEPVAAEETSAAAPAAEAAAPDAPSDEAVAEGTGPTAAATADEVDPVDIVGIAARTLASQLAPGTRIPSPALSALDSGRTPTRTTPAAKTAERVRPPADQRAAAPVRGTAPATSTARSRRTETVPTDEDRADGSRPTGDEVRPDAAGVDAPETSVVELLAKRAASTGSSVWSLAMNGGGGPASWALAPNAEAARKAAEEAVREALDNAGRADDDPAADAADRGTSPIVGRVPRRDR